MCAMDGWSKGTVVSYFTKVYEYQHEYLTIDVYLAISDKTH